MYVRQHGTEARAAATLVRVNPELPCADDAEKLAAAGVRFHAVKDTALAALRRMDAAIAAERARAKGGPRGAVPGGGLASEWAAFQEADFSVARASLE